ncbi:hypothetical protein [Rhodobacter capsulatus]|uniref:hypothetical protein n=1 Tax=Rhodobacter capsulatus TaxID=1061 RepID=UPI00373FD53A
MRRDGYGAKSEKGDPDQHHLPFEERAIAAPSVQARWRVRLRPGCWRWPAKRPRR